ncbi:hypothetical protein G7046_g8456 [Stylonectria norvegica]|nr:hypothetical protein G7046_g8456 [Stylonectria norvegica]
MSQRPRRNGRLPSREQNPAPSRDSPGTFVRPNLPALNGTPSSRRQYSYGSGVEPPPRPGSGLQRMDIRNAVGAALAASNDEPIEEEGFVRPPRPQARPAASDTEEDELAQGGTTSRRPDSSRNAYARPTTRSTGVDPVPEKSTNLRQNSGTGGSDADSLRSFLMESEYYGDATIRSTPESPPAAEVRKPPQRNPQRPSAPRLQNELQEHDSLPASSRSQHAVQTRERVSTAQPKEEAEEDFDESEEEDEYSTRNPYRNTRSANTPRPNAARPGTRKTKTRANQLEAEDADDSDRTSREGSPVIGLARGARFQSGGASTTMLLKPSNLGNGSNRTQTLSHNAASAPKQASRLNQMSQPPKTLQATQNPLQFTRTLGRTASKENPFSLNKNSSGNQYSRSAIERYASDASEMDDAMQRDIMQAEDELERNRLEEEYDRNFRQTEETQAALGRGTQVGRQQRGPTERWRHQWTHFLALLSLDSFWAFIRRHLRPTTEVDEYLDEDDVDTDVPVNWWRLLNPLMYLQTIVWVFDNIMDRAVHQFDLLSPFGSLRQIAAPGSALRWTLMGLFALALSMTLSTFVLGGTGGLSNRFPSPGGVSLPSFGLPGFGLPSFGGVTGKIGSFIPSIPWSPKSDDYDEDTMWETSGDGGGGQSDESISNFEKELNKLRKAGKLHESSIKKLQSVVPKIVHLELKDGKPVIAQEFWHAIRDLVHGDGSIMTLEKKGKLYEFTSEQQWQAIMSRISNDPAFKSTQNVSVSDIEGRMEQQATKFWDSWVKNNQDKMIEILRPTMDKVQVTGSDRGFDARITRLIKEHSKSSDHNEVLVTRDEFIQYVQNEFARNNKMFHAELEELRPQLETLMRDTIHQAARDAPQGMSQKDITKLVKSLTDKYISGLNLEGMAKGQIHQHWDVELKNQVNFFSQGSGATIDIVITSVIYDPYKKGLYSEDAYKKGIRGVNPYPASFALTSWEDEGDCWCAAREFNRRGNPAGASLSVQLAQRIIPQNVVIEHILPGATSDPDARPRNIEVYAAIEDEEIRERVKDFASVHFPADPESWNYEEAEYPKKNKLVKIGQFVYESSELTRGVHVHRLSPELVEIGADTDHVVVRAVSNYGSNSHTCFYRVRLFGA